MNIKLTALAAVSALGFASAAFAEPIDTVKCPANYWCEVPVYSIAASSGDVVIGGGWDVAILNGAVLVQNLGDDLNTTIVLPVEGGPGAVVTVELVSTLSDSERDEEYRTKTDNFNAGLGFTTDPVRQEQ